MSIIKLYTDGSCINNPGSGGWAFIMIDNDGNELYLSGCETFTTNNRMELKAVIEGLKLINDIDFCTIYSDSKLVINCASGLWKRNKNLDLWKEYDDLSKTKKNIKFEWVKGHNGDYYNDFVDKLAFEEAKKNDLK